MVPTTRWERAFTVCLRACAPSQPPGRYRVPWAPNPASMKKALTLLLIAAAVLGGLYGWTAWPSSSRLSERSLTFADVQKATLRDVVSATGLVEPREIIYVGSEMAGTVTRLVARANEVVTDGDELGQLDDRKYVIKL